MWFCLPGAKLGKQDCIVMTVIRDGIRTKKGIHFLNPTRHQVDIPPTSPYPLRMSAGNSGIQTRYRGSLKDPYYSFTRIITHHQPPSPDKFKYAELRREISRIDGRRVIQIPILGRGTQALTCFGVSFLGVREKPVSMKKRLNNKTGVQRNTTHSMSWQTPLKGREVWLPRPLPRIKAMKPTPCSQQ